jgi:hypothetical protein
MSQDEAWPFPANLGVVTEQIQEGPARLGRISRCELAPRIRDAQGQAEPPSDGSSPSLIIERLDRGQWDSNERTTSGWSATAQETRTSPFIGL